MWISKKLDKIIPASDSATGGNILLHQVKGYPKSLLRTLYGREH